MTHRSRIAKAVIDAPPADHDTELAFWQAASGLPLTGSENFSEYHGAELPGQEFTLLMQRLDGGAARVHLDIHTDDVEAEVTRLEKLGAARVSQVRDWWVMRDPAGLPFCVLPEEPAELTDANSSRWD